MTRKNTSPFPPEILQLDQQLGEFMEYWGFKRIHGRVWLHLYLADAPLDVAQLMSRLHVSKALMSFCIRDLKEYGVILEVGVAKHGTVLYSANPDLISVIQNVLRLRERPMLARIHASQQLAQSLTDAERKTHGIDLGRLKGLGKLVAGAEQALLTVVRLPSDESIPGGGLLSMLDLLGDGPTE